MVANHRRLVHRHQAGDPLPLPASRPFGRIRLGKARQGLTLACLPEVGCLSLSSYPYGLCIMYVNPSMPEVVFTLPQHFPYEFQVFRILRTEFEKICRKLCGKYAVNLLPYWLPAIWPRGSSREGTLASPGNPPCTLSTEGAGGGLSSPERSPTGQPVA